MSQVSYERYAESLSMRELRLELGYAEAKLASGHPLRAALAAELERRRS